MVFCLRPVNQIVLGTCLYSFIVSGILQFGLATCTLTTVKEEFGASYTEMSAVLVCFQITQIVFSCFAPAVETKTGLNPEAIAVIGFGINYIGILIYGFAQHYAMLIIGQLLGGAGAAGIYVFMPTMIARLVDDPAEISLGIAKSFTFTPIGIVVGLGGCSAANLEESPENWRWLFIGFGSLVAFPAILFFMINRRYTTHEDPRKKFAGTPTMWELKDYILTEKRVIFSILGFTCNALVIAAISSYLVSMFEEHLGYEKQVASLLVGATVPAVAVGTIVGGCITWKKRWTRGKLMAFCAFCMISPFLVVQIIFPGDVRHLAAVLACLVIGMFFMFMQAGPAVAVVAQLVPLHMIAFGNSAVSLVTRSIGGIAGPFILGALLDSGIAYNWAFFIITWFLVLGCIFYFIGWCVSPSAEQEAEEEEKRKAEVAEIEARQKSEREEEERQRTVVGGSGEEESEKKSSTYQPTSAVEPMNTTNDGGAKGNYGEKATLDSSETSTKGEVTSSSEVVSPHAVQLPGTPPEHVSEAPAEEA